MKKQLKFLKAYRMAAILGPLFKMLEALLELFIPLVVAEIIDTAIPSGDTGALARGCLLMAVLGIVGLGCSVTAQFFAAKASAGFARGLRQALMAHIQTLSFAQLDSFGASTLLNRMTGDMNQIQTGLNLGLRLLLRSPFVVFGAMIMAFRIDFRSALYFAVLIPMLGAVVFGIMLSCIPLYRKVAQKLDGLVGITRENLSGVPVIRAFRLEKGEESRFREQNDALTKGQLFVGRISALMNPITYIMLNITALLLIRTGAVQVQSGVLRQGQVVALYNYMAQILVELIKLASLVITMTKTAASSARVQAVLDEAPDMTSPDTPEKEPDDEFAISFRAVFMRYPGAGTETLRNISFSVRTGETVGIIGGTGSGKSTLVGLIPRFYDVSDGIVEVFGICVRQWPIRQLREKIAVVPQKPVLFRGTLRENLLWGNPDAGEDVLWEALRDAQVLDTVKEKGGLDMPIEQGGTNLSGGQRQRLTVARALVRRPEILILDDAASALDYATEARLRTSLRQLPYHPTVLIVSQRISSLAHADRIAVLDNGRLCGMDSHTHLLETCPTYREIYASQRKEGAE